LENGVPIFAICRGIQVLNVAAGGTLVQDIPSQVSDPIKHQQEAPRWYATHDISIQPGSRLAELAGGRALRVNSFHHQAVRQVGAGLRVAASAPDGIIEAIEGTTSRFVLGVQWHPELMVDHYPTAQKLFDEFVQAARDGQESLP
jgi:putative glutamine amidotransferase